MGKSMTAKPGKRHDEESVNFYIEQFCSKADIVYRLAFALTLNLDSAKKITEAVFKALSDDIENLAATTTNPRLALLKACWSHFRKGAHAAPTGQSALIGALGGLSVEARAAVVAVDYAGVGPDELEDIFGWEVKKSRTLLAEARRHMITADIKV